jgi:lysophospholipid acyltransferase (LPLAT)-like uncharacterized protein
LKRFEAAAIAVVGHRAIAVLGRTLRWRVEGLHHLQGILAAGRQPVMAFWHGSILGATYYFRRRGIVVMTSRNFDGEWIAGIIERFGYMPARGSTSRGAVAALVQMRREMGRGRAAGFTVDGPRGPARRAQPGAVWLAQATGNPMLPFHVEAERRWTAPSWDRTQVPYPFSRMALTIGAPIDVPASGSASAIEEKRKELERSLEALADRAVRLLEE